MMIMQSPPASNAVMGLLLNPQGLADTNKRIIAAGGPRAAVAMRLRGAYASGTVWAINMLAASPCDGAVALEWANTLYGAFIVAGMPKEYLLLAEFSMSLLRDIVRQLCMSAFISGTG